MSTYKSHTDDIQSHISDIRVNTNDIRMTCKTKFKLYIAFKSFRLLFSIPLVRTLLYIDANDLGY